MFIFNLFGLQGIWNVNKFLILKLDFKRLD